MITQYIIDWGLLESLILISMIWFHLYQLLDTENCDFNTIEFFCRSDNTQEELGELAKTANPDAIDIDDDFSSDEEAQVEGMIIFKMKILCNTYKCITLFSLCTLMISTCICNTLLGIELNHEWMLKSWIHIKSTLFRH